VARRVLEGSIRVTAGGLVGVGNDPTGSVVKSGIFVAALGVDATVCGEEKGEDEDEDVIKVTVLEGPRSGPSSGDCGAVMASCFRFPSLTPTATPMMILRKIRKMRIKIAMPLFVRYQRDGGTNEDESNGVG